MILRAALDECDVVLSPCHTAFPFLGGLTKKREFLGSGRRIYVSAANLCPEKQFKRINQLQTCFYLLYGFYTDNKPAAARSSFERSLLSLEASPPKSGMFAVEIFV